MFSKKKENIILQIKQHKDILIFVLVVVSFHAFWKIGREADATDQIIHFYGHDFSPFFSLISEMWAKIVYWFVHLFKGETLEMYDCSLRYIETGTGIRIVWGCSGIKEVIMAILIIVTANGSAHKKLWYIPIGVLFMLLLNFTRLAILTFLVHHHSEMFDFVHGVIFRAVMYGGLFGVWLLWTERIKKNKSI